MQIIFHFSYFEMEIHCLKKYSISKQTSRTAINCSCRNNKHSMYSKQNTQNSKQKLLQSKKLLICNSRHARRLTFC